MKKLSYVATAGLLFTSLAQAVVVPLWERPILEAKLTATGDTVHSRELRAFHLTMHKRDDSEAATTFTLVEDSGIRCNRAPCPSTKNTTFVVTGVHSSFHRGDSTRYVAREVLKNIRPNERRAPRTLNLTESSMELVAPGGGGFLRRTIWEVEVESFAKPAMTYYGRPTGVVTIQ